MALEGASKGLVGKQTTGTNNGEAHKREKREENHVAGESYPLACSRMKSSRSPARG